MKAKKQAGRILSNEKGFVLPLAFIFITIIAILGATAVIATTTDLRIATNYKTSVQTFYIAEAGLERARNSLRLDMDWSNTDWPTCWVTSGTIHVGGRAGNFTITTRDAERNSIIVTSTGTIAGATSVVEMLVTRNTLPNVEAAFGFVGDVGVTLDGRRFLIDGGADKFGITMSNFTNDNTQSPRSIRNELRWDNMANQVTGRGTNPSVGSALETRDNITKFAATMKDAADDENKITALPCGDVGNITKGDNPKIVHISATKDKDFKGSITGVGILIIEGDDFCFAFANGTIDWKGLVVITADSVGGSLGNNVKIHGTLIINDAIQDEWRWFGIAGEMELIYSQNYLDIAQQTVPASVSSWRQVHN